MPHWQPSPICFLQENLTPHIMRFCWMQPVPVQLFGKFNSKPKPNDNLRLLAPLATIALGIATWAFPNCQRLRCCTSDIVAVQGRKGEMIKIWISPNLPPRSSYLKSRPEWPPSPSIVSPSLCPTNWHDASEGQVLKSFIPNWNKSFTWVEMRFFHTNTKCSAKHIHCFLEAFCQSRIQVEITWFEDCHKNQVKSITGTDQVLCPQRTRAGRE